MQCVSWNLILVVHVHYIPPIPIASLLQTKCSALFCASEGGHEDIVSLLVASNADTNMKNCVCLCIVMKYSIKCCTEYCLEYLCLHCKQCNACEFVFYGIVM